MKCGITSASWPCLKTGKGSQEVNICCDRLLLALETTTGMQCRYEVEYDSVEKTQS